MRHINKSGTQWTLFAVGLLAVGIFVLAESLAAVEPNQKPFSSVQKQLIKDGFDSVKINKLYRRPQVFFEADGVTLLFTYKEAQVDYGQFANKWSIRKAKQYMTKHKTQLAHTEKLYGVDKSIITAILLVETGLGASVGTRSTLNTLSTTFLKYTNREGFDPASIPGSFAGAVGVAQFMPTSIMAYGQDGDNDGIVDMHNHADSMASIANFLKSHGWRPGQNRKKAGKIIYYYNHSTYYVDTILKISKRLQS
jgi:membrane-bound lytic murein transglycosylase B